MKEQKAVVVVGLGEVGKPLLELVSQHHCGVGVDVSPPEQQPSHVDVLHICYPYQIDDFVAETVRYVDLFRPDITVINSTVEVGTTRAIAQAARSAVAYSPVRGKHSKMLSDMKSYTKFVGAPNAGDARKAAAHFASLDLKTRILQSSEAVEVAKLSETTFFGLMIAWA